MSHHNVKRVNAYAPVLDVTDTDHKFTFNGWQSLVSELVEPPDSTEGEFAVAGTILYFPGVTFKQLKKK